MTLTEVKDGTVIAETTQDTRKDDNKPQTKPYHSGEGIMIGTDWRLTADPNNVVLWRRQGKAKPRWRVEGYFSTIDNALVALLRRGVRETELASIEVVQNKIIELERDIIGATVGAPPA